MLWLERSASAQPQASVPNCASNPACNALFEQAQQQSKAGNLPEAHRLYKLAYEVQADPALLYSIARVLHKQGQTREAVPYYRRFLDTEIEAKEQRQRASDYLAEIDRNSSVDSPAAPAFARDQSSPKDALGMSKSSLPSSQASEKPIYKRWWFWTIIFGATAVVAAGTAVGVSARQPDLTGVPQYRLFPSSL